jgi:hypothetical protein
MALKGNLRDFSITQLLNLVNIAQKTGVLILERPDEKVVVSFLKGKIAYAQAGSDDGSLVTVLYRAKRITASQYKAIQERAKNITDKELGLLLINANYISQQDIISILQTHFTNVVNKLFTWVEGLFRFENDILPPDGKITVRISLENIIIEGSRRLKELEHLQDEIPSLDIAMKFTERPGTNLRNVNLSVDEWKVVSFINPKNTIRQIASATKKNDLEIRRIVYGLLQAGLVELVRPEGVLPAQVQNRPAMPQASKEEQKSLINRLISRIRTI